MSPWKKAITLWVAVGFLSVSYGARAQEGPDGVLDAFRASLDPRALQPGGYGPWPEPLGPIFDEAAARYDVPRDLLLALGYLGSAFENRGDQPTIEYGYGVMALRENAWGGNSLAQAAELLGAPRDAVRSDPRLSILGAAAVLDASAKDAKIDRAAGVEAWLGPVIEYAGLDPENSRFFAMEVFQRLAMGFSKSNTSGETFVVKPRAVAVNFEALAASPMQILSAPTDCGNPDYSGAVWDPAASCNYSTTVGTKDTVVIHIIEGTAAGCRSYFKNCSAGVSAHYVLDTVGGVWQMVCERHTAWHVPCGNSRSIGLEHEGYTADATHPEAMYQASANAVRDMCNRWGIPKVKARQSPGILAHIDITECLNCGTHTDPGRGWDFTHYLALINQTSDPTTFIVESRSGGQNYANYSETGTGWGNSTAKSNLWGTTAGIGTRYNYMTGTKTAVYRYTPAIGGTYKVFVTWPTSSNATQNLDHIVTHAGGSTTVVFDTRSDTNPCGRNNWNLLGQFTLNAGTQYTVTQTTQYHQDGMVIRPDAVKWELVSAGGVQPPTITQHPAAQNICPGGTATFTVAATGEGTLTYQWQKNQSNLSNGGHYSGVTTTTLTVSSADSNDAASYRCVVSNAGGSTNSNAAALTLKAATTITQHPQPQTVAPGGTATFTVAATGDGTLSYQWQKNQANLSNGGHYSGVTTATLTISSADSNDAANYRCVVTGGCGSAASNEASLTVQSVQTIISDNFDGYADQAALQAVWIPVGTSLALSTEQYYSSPKSVYSASGSTARQNKRTFAETIGTDASPITVSFRFYDPGGTGTANQWVEIRDYAPSTKQLIEVGVYSGCSTTYYSARVAYSPGNNWQAMNQNGAPARSAGWHYFRVVIKSTTVDFYVDNVLGSPNRAYASSEGSVSFEEIRVGSGYASTSLAAYYDDVKVEKGGGGASPPLLAAGDFDGDSDVDLADFVVFQGCYNGPNAPPATGCSANADLDADGDVDLTDLTAFQACFNGPNQPPGC